MPTILRGVSQNMYHRVAKKFCSFSLVPNHGIQGCKREHQMFPQSKVVAILSNIIHHSGIQVKPVFAGSQEDAYEMIKQGKADFTIFPGTVSEPPAYGLPQSTRKFLAYTSLLQSAQNLFVYAPLVLVILITMFGLYRLSRSWCLRTIPSVLTTKSAIVLTLYVEFCIFVFLRLYTGGLLSGILQNSKSPLIHDYKSLCDALYNNQVKMVYSMNQRWVKRYTDTNATQNNCFATALRRNPPIATHQQMLIQIMESDTRYIYIADKGIVDKYDKQLCGYGVISIPELQVDTKGIIYASNVSAVIRRRIDQAILASYAQSAMIADYYHANTLLLDRVWHNGKIIKHRRQCPNQAKMISSITIPMVMPVFILLAAAIILASFVLLGEIMTKQVFTT